MGGDHSAVVDQVAGHLHSSNDEGAQVEAARAAANFLADLTKQKINVDAITTDEHAGPVLQSILFYFLNEHAFNDAARLMWTKTQFTCEPECTTRVWDALDASAGVIIPGGASVSKSYGCGVYFFQEWISDPEYTSVKVLGPSEQHLQDNLFSHLVELWRSSRIPLPGRIGDLFIGLDLRQRRSSITGVVIPLGKKPAGRLQGSKRYPRRTPHKIHGAMSRMRILLDEAENIPQGIWSDIDNVLANSEGTTGLKIACAYNPKDSSLPLGVRAEPEGGWRMFDVDSSYEWTSARGWRVIRLDGERSENVKEGRVVYPGLQTAEGLEKLAESSGGKESASYYTFGRGAYPQKGAAFTIIPATTINKMVAEEVLWLEKPMKVSGADLALEGGDKTIHVGGLLGLSLGYKLPKSVEHPDGSTVEFKNARGAPVARWMAYATELKPLDRGETIAMARAVKLACQSFGTSAKHVCCDRTGHGAGVHDVLREIWSPLVEGINYSQSATHRKIMHEDKQFCDDLYLRIVTELWFAMAKWGEFDVLKCHPLVLTGDLSTQLGSRQFKPGLKNKVESKKEYRMRTSQGSPDEADALSLFVHACRSAIPDLPSATPELSAASGQARKPVFIIGASNRHEYLD